MGNPDHLPRLGGDRQYLNGNESMLGGAQTAIALWRAMEEETAKTNPDKDLALRAITYLRGVGPDHFKPILSQFKETLLDPNTTRATGEHLIYVLGEVAQKGHRPEVTAAIVSSFDQVFSEECNDESKGVWRGRAIRSHTYQLVTRVMARQDAPTFRDGIRSAFNLLENYYQKGLPAHSPLHALHDLRRIVSTRHLYGFKVPFPEVQMMSLNALIIGFNGLPEERKSDQYEKDEFLNTLATIAETDDERTGLNSEALKLEMRILNRDFPNEIDTYRSDIPRIGLHSSDPEVRGLAASYLLFKLTPSYLSHDSRMFSNIKNLLMDDFGEQLVTSSRVREAIIALRAFIILHQQETEQKTELAEIIRSATSLQDLLSRSYPREQDE